MDFKVLIFGPQLVGVILIVVGFIQQKYPPKKINKFYGYRTPLAMKNQENWDEGNRFSARLTIKLGFILLLAGIAVTLLLQLIANKALKEALTFLSIIGGSMSCVVLMMGKTERHLEKFEENEL